MNYAAAFKQVVELRFDEPLTILNSDGIELYVVRPSELSAKFRQYDPAKNFQIWLRQGERNFRPNHLRVMIDLHLRVRSRRDLKAELGSLFDALFYKTDLTAEHLSLFSEHFEHYLNPLPTIAQLSQLFLIEQEYGYPRESNFDPGTLFYQGWVRQVIADSGKEIDNFVVSIARGQPPSPRYTSQDDKKHRKFVENREPLWWLS